MAVDVEAVSAGVAGSEVASAMKRPMAAETWRLAEVLVEMKAAGETDTAEDKRWCGVKC